MAQRSSIGYWWPGGALLRASTVPAHFDLPRHLDTEAEDFPQRAARWMGEIWTRHEVRDAVSTASPRLSHQIDNVISGTCRDRRRVRKTVLSLAAYLLRWQRPTPFGLFAGVASLNVEHRAHVRWGDKHRASVRPDGQWLGEIVAWLERCPQLLDRLTVVANDAGQVRGHRFVVPGPPADGHTALIAPIEVSVRHTEPVAAALEAARTPINHGELRNALAARFPTAGCERLRSLLRALLDQNMLITNLRAPMTTVDALEHVCTELDRAAAHNIADIADLAASLREIHDECDGPVPVTDGARRAELERTMRRISTIVPTPLVVDSMLDCDVRVPQQVIREVEKAGDLLRRLSPRRFGHPAWRDYHARFRSRYGPGAVVPVLDLVADSGLGLPAGFLGSGRGRSPRHLDERDETILALLQRAFLDGHHEITLTQETLADLEGPPDGAPIAAPRIEVAVEVRARSLPALDSGDFSLVVTGAPRPASSMIGRFAHLLPDDAQTRLRTSYQVDGPDVVAAQLTFAPRRRRNDNVARTQRLLPYVLPLAEHHPPGDDVIRVSDLGVTADARRFHVVELSSGRRVEPRVTHALEAGVHTPPLARFLAEIATARCTVHTGFDFGAAANLPFLPQVRYGRVVLAPARWMLERGALPGRSVSQGAWDEVFARWRSRLRVPDHVALVEYEQRLPLDLTHRLHRCLLRSRLDNTDRLELRATASDEEFAWIGRPHELVVPLRCSASADDAPRRARVSPAVVSHLPGRSPVLYSQVHAHPDHFDEIVSEHLPHLVSTPETQRWWFQHERDFTHTPERNYLGIYMRLPGSDSYGSAAASLHDWAEALRDQRLVSHLVLSDHTPQTGRFGDNAVWEAAEEVFAADSRAALAQQKAARRGGISVQALAAVSMVDLASSLSPTRRQGLQWLVDHLADERGRVDRTVREQALGLCQNGAADVDERTGGEGVASVWGQRADALAAYRNDLLRSQRDPFTVLRSLLHLHHRRTVFGDRESEAATHRMARACALRHLATAGVSRP